MILLGVSMKTWTGKAAAQNEGGRVEAKKTGIGTDQGRGEGREMLRGSEKGGESISPAMIAKRREYSDPCNLLNLLYASRVFSLGSINPRSLCTIRSPRFNSKSP